MHAHEARRATGGRRAHRAALEHGDPGTASSQVEGEARTLDPGAHDDDVGRCLHRRILDSTPGGMQTMAGFQRYRTEMATRASSAATGPRAGATAAWRESATTVGRNFAADRPRGRRAGGSTTLLLGCASPRPIPRPTPPPPDARSVSGTITEDGLRSGLAMLADVTDASNGYRSLGSPGYAAAAEAVATSLRASGWTVSDDAFTAPTFTDDGGSSLEAGGQRFGDDDIRPLIFAPAGDVTGPVVALDWRPGVTARDGKGCRTADYGELPDGAVVLVRPGPCFRRDQVMAAQAAGAAAFVAGYGGALSGAAPRATLVDPGGLTIPAIGATGRAADALAVVAETGGVARVTTTGRTAEAATRSIIAELPGSEPSSVVMLGAHLNSVLDGPGLNDDGSGVAALLAIARALQGTRPRATVRLAFWSGEELGLLGSSHYVAGLTDAERAAVVAYLNADMIGSPNGYAGVYHEADAPSGSAALGASWTRPSNERAACPSTWPSAPAPTTSRSARPASRSAASSLAPVSPSPPPRPRAPVRQPASLRMPVTTRRAMTWRTSTLGSHGSLRRPWPM